MFLHGLLSIQIFGLYCSISSNQIEMQRIEIFFKTMIQLYIDIFIDFAQHQLMRKQNKETYCILQ